MDDESGFCRGCYRTLEEIARWSMMGDEQKKDVLRMISTRRPENASHSGFTLFEITILMAVVGALAALISVGSVMIDNARLRKQITQIEQIQASVQNFITKYNCYPGDCADPTIISGYTYTGNGDGFLGNTWNNNENKGFWLHLTLSNMLVETLYSHPFLISMKLPRSVINPMAAIHAYGSACYGQNVLEFATMTASQGSLTTTQIRSIDTKTDDGKPDSGFIRSTGYSNSGQVVYSVAPVFPLSVTNNGGSDDCVVLQVGTGYVYSSSATNSTCNLIYLLDTKRAAF